MDNHIHLIVVPRQARALAATLKPVHLRHAQEFNRRMGVGGVLWQGRFFSCPLDEQHFWAAVRYVERNPVRAGLVQRGQDWPWSSAAAHCGQRPDVLLPALPPRPAWLGDWSAWLSSPEDEQTVDRLRLCTRTGRPAGTSDFLDRLERLLGRILRPQKGGRPRKKKKHG
jgi:putative transposase